MTLACASNNVIDCKFVPEKAMSRIMLTLASLITACTPSPQKVAMPITSSTQSTPAQGSSNGAAQTAAGTRWDTPEQAEGRRTISTAFVRVGPDGNMTVELVGGRVLVLRNVVVRPTDYCGVEVSGGAAGRKYCGGFAEVVAARPGGAPPAAQPDVVASNPAASANAGAAGKQ